MFSLGTLLRGSCWELLSFSIYRDSTAFFQGGGGGADL